MRVIDVWGIALIMFVLVCTAQRSASPQEDGKSSNNQTQGSDKNRGYVPFVSNAATDYTGTNQPGAEYSKGNPSPTRKEEDGKEPWVARVSLIISLVGAGIALWSAWQTDRTRRITERAYLAAEQWELEGGSIICTVTNRGRTPAKLLSGHTEYTLWASSAAAEFEAQRKVDRDFGESDLPAQGAFPMQVGILGEQEWRAVKDQRTLILRVMTYIQYRDVFGKEWPMNFAMEYDGRISRFILADKRSATKSRK